MYLGSSSSPHIWPVADVVYNAGTITTWDIANRTEKCLNGRKRWVLAWHDTTVSHRASLGAKVNFLVTSTIGTPAVDEKKTLVNW